MDFMIKDYSGIKVADKNYKCCDCEKDILQGERYLRHKAVSGIKIKCLKYRQKSLDLL